MHLSLYACIAHARIEGVGKRLAAYRRREK